MTYLLRKILFILISITTILSANASISEKLSYKVVYRWGLVNKTAGRAAFYLTESANGKSTARMYARTEPWADHFYKVRDTLISTFNTSTCIPTSYTRIAHEGGRYASDKVLFSRSGNISSAKCIRLRRGKSDKTTSRTETTLSANGDAVDLLSSFYYLRKLDFSNMKIGETRVINIFSGKRKEILKITYNGPTRVKIDGKKTETLLVTFTFTSGQGKTTSKPIKAWLSPNGSHIPLKLVGELKIGRVECIYNGS